MEGRCAISGSCELGLTMSNNTPKVPVPPPFNKRQKKTKEVHPSWSGLWSLLPDAVALNCLAHASRSDLAALAVASKCHRSLVASPDLWDLRWRMGCRDTYFYVCLRIFPDPNPRWFILNRNRRLGPIPIPPNPYQQAPESSSFVVVDRGIYVIGGIMNGNRISDVFFFDCCLHTWHRVPSMRTARACPSASLIDGKIYVFGGCGKDADSPKWAWEETFDIKTQTWGKWLISKIRYKILQSVVVDEKKVYGVDEERRSFYFMPSQGMFLRMIKYDSKPGFRNDWCAIGKLLFCRGTRGTILWCEPDELDWKQVKGLENLRHCLYGPRQVLNTLNPCTELNRTPSNDISRLSSNSAGNIVVFWTKQLEDREGLELWSAEISVERREESEIWGKIEWSNAVFKLDHRSHSDSIKVLYSASVNV